MRTQLIFDLIGSLIVHRHGKTSHLFPLGINRRDHKDDVGIGLFKLIQDDFQIGILGRFKVAVVFLTARNVLEMAFDAPIIELI